MVKVKRVPIKVRKPIFLETCNCWNIKTFSVEGEDRMIKGSSLGTDQLKKFMQETDQMLPVVLHSDEEDKAHLCLDNNIPVTLMMDRIPSQDILDKMYSVPYCSMFMDMEIEQSNNLFEVLEKSKANSISISLMLKYSPGDVHILDLYEYIDKFKNFASHVMITIPEINGDEPVGEVIKKAYMPDVPNRKWVPKPLVKETYIEKMKEYLKPRKLTLEYMYPVCDDGEVRQVKELSKEPFGIKGFFYKKIDGEFKAFEGSEGFNCSVCEKPIFR